MNPFNHFSRALLISLVVLLSFNQGNTQNEETFRPFYVSLNALSGADLFDLDANELYGRQLAFVSTPTIAFGYDFNKYIGLEGTLGNRPMAIGKIYHATNSVSSSSSVWIRYFNVALKHHISLFKAKVKLQPQVGYMLGYTNESGFVGSSTTVLTINNQDYTSTATTQALKSGFHHFLTAGLSLEYIIKNRIGIHVGYRLFKGFHNIVQEDYTYEHNSDSGSFTALVNGTFGGVNLGASYYFNIGKKESISQSF